MNAIDKLISTLKRLHHAPLPEYPDAGFCMKNSKLRKAYFGDYSGHNCGTAACIMGWAKIIFTDGVYGGFEWCRGAGDRYAWLIMPGRNPEDPCRYNFIESPEKFTLPAAIAVLEILRDEGAVDWNRAIDNPWSPDQDEAYMAERDRFDVSEWLKSLTDELGAPAPFPVSEEPKRTKAQ